MHATILKGIVGGFEFTVLQRNLKELARKDTKMCLRVLNESNKSRFDSYSRQEQCIDHIPYYLSGLSHMYVFMFVYHRICLDFKCGLPNRRSQSIQKENTRTLRTQIKCDVEKFKPGRNHVLYRKPRFCK